MIILIIVIIIYRNYLIYNKYKQKKIRLNSLYAIIFSFES